ncbi:MAG: prephenate dehydrogenase/arogenate dehydrogenase family protein [Candidatus Bathyarchaeia archaeon]
MKIAIIGLGKMGEWFTRFFLNEGIEVVVSDKDEEKLQKVKKELDVETLDNVKSVQNVNRVFICVPIENFEEVVAEIHPYIRRGQEVMEICSVKEQPVDIMHKYIKNSVVLGVHPMFGPGVKNIQNQKFILTPTSLEEKKLAETFGGWLRERGAKVFFMSPKEHDELMSIVLGLPYFLSLAFCDALISHKRFSDAKKVSGVSFKILLTLAEAIASERAEFSASLQTSLPQVDKIEELFLNKAADWLKLVRTKDRSAFIDKVNLLKLSLEKIDPFYSKSYIIMHKMLEAVKNCGN